MVRRFFAGILLTLFLGLSIPLFLIWGSYNVLADKDFYTGEFLDITLSFSIDQIVDQFDVNKFSSLNGLEIRDIVKKAITKGDIELMINAFIDQIVNTEVSAEDKVNLKLPLDWLVLKFDTISNSIAEALYLELPNCTDIDSIEELKQNREELKCIPKNLAEEDFKIQVSAILDREVFSEIPDDFVFDMKVSPGVTGSLGEFLEKIIHSIFIAGLAISVILLIFIALIIFRPFSSILMWEGTALFWFSAVSLISLYWIFPNIFVELYSLINKTGDYKLIEYTESIFNIFADKLLLNLRTYAFIALILGVILFIFGVINKFKSKKT